MKRKRQSKYRLMKRALEVIETMSVYTVDGEIKDLTEHIYIIALGVCSYNKAVSYTHLTLPTN